jgi:tight adherence protein B
MEILIGLGVFLFTLLVLHQGYFFVKRIYKPEQRKVQSRLKTLSLSGHGNEAIDILKKKTLSEIPWLNEMLLKTSFIERLERLHGQASTPHPLGYFVVLSALLFFAGILLATVLKLNQIAVALPSVFLAMSPFLYLLRKRKKRMEKFERQLPEALELVSRALKAGHAFTGGMKMVAEEFGDPVGAEFGKTLDEINFGAGVPEALTNMTQRVDCDDLKFFAVSVIIQRETGGNLAEILENLGHLIRERFKFQGRVRVLSSEGRLSAIVLVVIPFLIAGVFSLLRPEYIRILFSDAIGRVLVAMALVMMGCGIYIMKKMVSLKV